MARADSVPTWAIGLVVAVLAWRPAFLTPVPGLDVSWWSGLYMAAHDRMEFGREIVFTYGPLGFLKLPWLFYPDLSALAYLYTSAVFVGFCIALAWAIRRAAGPVAALFGSFLVVALVPGIEWALAIAVFAAFGVLSRRPGDAALRWYAAAAGVFAAAEVLMKLSVGPLILLVLAIGLACCRPRRDHLLLFGGAFGTGFFAFWWATGQPLGGLPDFTLNSLRITSGYNEAMAIGAAWWKPLPLLGATALTIGWAWTGAYPGRRERAGALVIAILVGFAAYKQGIVRADRAHVEIFLTTMAVLWLAVPVDRGRIPVSLGAATALLLVATAVIGSPSRPGMDVFERVNRLADAARVLVDGDERKRLVEAARTGVLFGYEVEPGIAYGMVDRSVAVEPWETMVAWAYQLDWDPVPIFQNYSAYTRSLDEMNAEAVSSPDGAETILRQGGPPPGESIDGRLQVWDPPAQAVATLCNFRPSVTAQGWQLLERAPDRCGEPLPAGTVEADEGEPVPVPEPAANEVVLVRIDGVEPSALRKLVSLVYRPPMVHVVTDDDRFRLVPATAGDGLLLRSGRNVRGDRGRFAPIPQIRNIAVDGAGDDLEFEFFRMEVR